MTAIIIAVVVLLLAALVIGLCRAAADVRDVEPDAGEYE